MARDLGDVLHYFLDDRDDASAREAGRDQLSAREAQRDEASAREGRRDDASAPDERDDHDDRPTYREPDPSAGRDRSPHPERDRLIVDLEDELLQQGGDALPVVAVPLGPRDVVRAAFVWNLAVEIARTGAAASVVAPRAADTEALWPAPGVGPLGAELALCNAETLADLTSTAREVAELRGGERAKPGLVLLCIPTDWADPAATGSAWPDWTLLFTTPDARELRACYGLAERLLRQAPGARVGVTVHGVSGIAEARAAFFQLATATERNLGRSLLSYGLLLDDLHVYRAIVSLRPIGLAHPQSRGARAVGDVARLLMEDARLEGLRAHG